MTKSVSHVKQDTGKKSDKSHTSGTRKSGGQRERDGRDYETAVQHVLTNLIAKHPHLNVEALPTVEIDEDYFTPLLDKIKDNLDVAPWQYFFPEASRSFAKLEIDLILKISVNEDDATSDEERPKSVFIPYDTEDEEVGYDINLENGPVIVYFEITNNPYELNKKLWQVERFITLHNILSSQSEEEGSLLIPSEPIQTEMKPKIETWESWIKAGHSAYYSIVSNSNRNTWLDNFVSKLCIFHEQSFFDFGNKIEFKPELEKDLLELLVKNKVGDLANRYKEKQIVKTNALKHTNVGLALRESKMLFIFVETSLSSILNSFGIMQKEHQKTIEVLEKKHQGQIETMQSEMDKMRKEHEDGQRLMMEKMSELLREMKELKTQK